jgi:hypothetical protein
MLTPKILSCGPLSNLYCRVYLSLQRFWRYWTDAQYRADEIRLKKALHAMDHSAPGTVYPLSALFPGRDTSEFAPVVRPSEPQPLKDIPMDALFADLDAQKAEEQQREAERKAMLSPETLEETLKKLRNPRRSWEIEAQEAYDQWIRNLEADIVASHHQYMPHFALMVPGPDQTIAYVEHGVPIPDFDFTPTILKASFYN